MSNLPILFSIVIVVYNNGINLKILMRMKLSCVLSTCLYCLLILFFLFHKTQCPLLYVSQDSTPFVFSFIGLNILHF